MQPARTARSPGHSLTECQEIFGQAPISFLWHLRKEELDQLPLVSSEIQPGQELVFEFRQA